jgi:glyoxylase-like metal-dependent hydrolase (beta-lactamase superfamily II)
MAIGDWFEVPDCTDLYYVDVGAYGIPGYGTVYVIDAERPAVVDTGLGLNREYVFDCLDALGVEPVFVVATHVHLDHAGGAGYLAERYPDATVLTPERGVEHLVDPSRLVAGTKAAVEDQWKYYDEPVPVPEDRIRGLTDGDEIDLGDRSLHTHHAPGHAPHHAFFHDDGDDVVFTADAAGIYVPETGEVRPTSPPAQFHLDKCLADAEAIANVAPDVLCYGHFGPRPYHEGVMDEYKRTLVEWVEAVRQKREELPDDDAVVEYFMDHTDMVEVWGEEKAQAEDRLNTKGVLGYLDYVGRADDD